MFPVQNYHHCCNSGGWQSSFYHQYMQQHAAMTQWIQQFHQNIPPQNSSHMNAYGDGWYGSQYPTHPPQNYTEDYPSGQPTPALYENSVSYSEPAEIVSDCEETPDDDDESECEYEFNVDAILAMRAAKKELDKVSEESEESFVVIETEKEEFDFIELGSLKTLESKRAKSVGREDANKEYNTQKEIMNHLYGKMSAGISGLETAMSVNFEHFCDKYQPPLWPVLPVRL